MPCTERCTVLLALTVGTVMLLAGCTAPAPPAGAPTSVQTPSPPAPQESRPSAPAVAATPATAQPLPAPRHSRTWAEYRRQAAERLIAANPQGSYTSTPPDVLLAIPVVEIELNRDGSIRRIAVLRHPKQARDTTEIAFAAIHRAAPFGDVAHLPRPWKFAETFLFDDHRRFKPRTLED